ncbi:MAG TPA: hypothetical protein VGD31_10265 [Sphingobacteriaceae bacterium]
MPLFIEQIILFIGKMKGAFRRIRCSFKVGDMVELRDGTGYPMLVTEVDQTKQMKEPLLYCRWYDRETKETRFNFFQASKVKSFDWKIKESDR